MFNLHFHLAESSIADWIQAGMAILQAAFSGIGIFLVYKTFQQGNRNLEIANKNIALAYENNKLQNNAFKNTIRPRFGLDTPLSTEVQHQDLPWHTFVFTVSTNDALDVKILAFDTEYISFHDAKNWQHENHWEMARFKIGDRLSMYIKVVSLTDAQLRELQYRFPDKFRIEIRITFADEMGYTYIQALSTTLDKVANAQLQAAKPVDWDAMFE